MNVRTVLVAVLIVVAVGAASASQVTVAAGVNLYPDCGLGVRAGLEYEFHPRMGVKFDLGASLSGTLEADLFYFFRLLPADSRFDLNLLVGIPAAGAPVTFDGAMVSFGASLAAGYRFTPAWALDLRAGYGFPLFFEPGKELIRQTRFALTPDFLWPDLVLAIKYRPQRGR